MDEADIEPEIRAGRGDAEKACDPGGRGAAENLGDEGRRTAALHQDIGPQTIDELPPGMIVAAEPLNEIGFGAIVVVVEDVDVETALRAHQRREKADRSAAAATHRPRLPPLRPLPHTPTTLP